MKFGGQGQGDTPREVSYGYELQNNPCSTLDLDTRMENVTTGVEFN